MILALKCGTLFRREPRIDVDVKVYATPERQTTNMTSIRSFAVLCLPPRLSVSPERTSTGSSVRVRSMLTVFCPSTTSLSNWKNWLTTVCLCDYKTDQHSTLAAS